MTFFVAAKTEAYVQHQGAALKTDGTACLKGILHRTRNVFIPASSDEDARQGKDDVRVISRGSLFDALFEKAAQDIDWEGPNPWEPTTVSEAV
jgi:hypothetical protein